MTKNDLDLMKQIYLIINNVTHYFNGTLVIQSFTLNKETLPSTDLMVLTTNHTAFVNFIQQHAKLIVDMINMIGGSRYIIY